MNLAEIQQAHSTGDHRAIWADIVHCLPKCDECWRPSTHVMQEYPQDVPRYRCSECDHDERPWEPAPWLDHVVAATLLGLVQPPPAPVVAPTVKRLLRVGGGNDEPDVTLDVAEGADLVALAARETEARGSWCEFVPRETIEAELRLELWEAAYLLGSAKEVHRSRGAELRVSALKKAAALGIELPDPTPEEMRAAGLLRGDARAT